MREIVLRLPKTAVEDVLDRLLPQIPDGVREVPVGGQVDLHIRGECVPPLDDVRRAVARWPCRLSEREVPDDWRERRVADYEPTLIGGRLVVRPDWAPAPLDGSIDIVLAESAAFGSATHPTTRTCLELLLGLKPYGAFADLGCGTGILALLAAKLGWAPVLAFDLQPASVVSTIENARLNGSEIAVEAADLSERDPPAVVGFAANLPAALHRVVAGRWNEHPPCVGLLSGFGPAEAGSVLDQYAAIGLRERRRVDSDGWTAVVVEA